VLLDAAICRFVRCNILVLNDWDWKVRRVERGRRVRDHTLIKKVRRGIMVGKRSRMKKNGTVVTSYSFPVASGPSPLLPRGICLRKQPSSVHVDVRYPAQAASVSPQDLGAQSVSVRGSYSSQMLVTYCPCPTPP
jgi:hypothetical protein